MTGSAVASLGQGLTAPGTAMGSCGRNSVYVGSTLCFGQEQEGFVVSPGT